MNCACGQFHDASAGAHITISATTSHAAQSPLGKAFAEPRPSQPCGALARLVKNTDVTAGLPPYALTDQSGTVQRYVEPVDGIDLDSYLNQVVVVRHDTGRTLLASQLDLPEKPLLPLVDGAAAAIQSANLDAVRQVQFADDDDATVELLPDMEMASGSQTNTDSRESKPDDTTISNQETLVPSLEPMSSLEGPGSFDGTRASEELPGEWDFTEPCPRCGGFHVSPECNPTFGGHGAWQQQHAPPARLFADVEFNFFRTHMVDTPLGKLSEKYEFSPRVSVGFRDTGKLDGRARYWSYDHDTRLLSGGVVNVEFDVLDLEGTHLFLGRRSELQLASGLRLASIDLSEGGTTAGANLLGITFAADGRTCLGEFQDGLFTWTYGGRLSVLGGDWGGEAGNVFITGRTQDDNVVVHELHAGVEYVTCYRDFEFHTRLGFEMQNWHSDALAHNSIGIIGPGIQFGAEF